MIKVQTFDYAKRSDAEAAQTVEVEHGSVDVTVAGLRVKIIESDGYLRLHIDPVNRDFIARVDTGVISANLSQIMVIARGRDIRDA